MQSHGKFARASNNTKKIKSKFSELRTPQTEKEANRTVSYVRRVFGTLTRESNIIEVGPVFMFDATRFGIGTGRPFNLIALKYGIGTEVRLSLVNLDFTAGYSVNPNKKFGEPPGAFLFRMAINDLFR